NGNENEDGHGKGDWNEAREDGKDRDSWPMWLEVDGVFPSAGASAADDWGAVSLFSFCCRCGFPRLNGESKVAARCSNTDAMVEMGTERMSIAESDFENSPSLSAMSICSS